MCSTDTSSIVTSTLVTFNLERVNRFYRMSLIVFTASNLNLDAGAGYLTSPGEDVKRNQRIMLLHQSTLYRTDRRTYTDKDQTQSYVYGKRGKTLRNNDNKGKNYIIRIRSSKSNDCINTILFPRRLLKPPSQLLILNVSRLIMI